jgi:hypothetical protein
VWPITFLYTLSWAFVRRRSSWLTTRRTDVVALSNIVACCARNTQHFCLRRVVTRVRRLISAACASLAFLGFRSASFNLTQPRRLFSTCITWRPSDNSEHPPSLRCTLRSTMLPLRSSIQSEHSGVATLCQATAVEMVLANSADSFDRPPP